MRIAVFATCPKRIYSGGRYHALMVAATLARLGHESYFVANNKPVFASEFEGISPDNPVRYIITNTFDVFADRRFDAVFVAPQLAPVRRLYTKALRFARQTGATPFLINYETPNWFNKLSPSKRDPEAWAEWKLLPAEGAMILCSARENLVHARSFDRDLPPETRFDVWEPAINSVALDLAGKVERQKRIVLSAGATDKHKGGEDIVRLFRPELKDYLFTVIVGNERDAATFAEEMREQAEAAGCSIEFLFGVTEVEKFRLIKSAAALLFPSYFEGYGYPPMEAMACNTPVVAYDLPVLRETCGKHVWFAPPGHVVALGDQLLAALKAPLPQSADDPAIHKLVDIDERAKALEQVVKRYRRYWLSHREAQDQVAPETTFEVSAVSRITMNDRLLLHFSVWSPRRINNIASIDPWAEHVDIHAGPWVAGRRIQHVFMSGPADEFDEASFLAMKLVGSTVGGAAFALSLKESEFSRDVPLFDSSAGASRVLRGSGALSVEGWVFPKADYDAVFWIGRGLRTHPTIIALPNNDYRRAVHEDASGFCGFSALIPSDELIAETPHLVLLRNGVVTGICRLPSLADMPLEHADGLGNENHAPEFFQLPSQQSGGRLVVSPVAAGPDYIRVRGWTNVFDRHLRVVVSQLRRDRQEKVETEFVTGSLNLPRGDVATRHGVDVLAPFGLDMVLPLPSGAESTEYSLRLRAADITYGGADRLRVVAEAPPLQAILPRQSPPPPPCSAALPCITRVPRYEISEFTYNASTARLHLRGKVLTQRDVGVALYVKGRPGAIAETVCNVTEVSAVTRFGYGAATEYQFDFDQPFVLTAAMTFELRSVIDGHPPASIDIGLPVIVGIRDFRIIDAAYDENWSLLWMRGVYFHPQLKLREIKVLWGETVLCNGVIGVKQRLGTEVLAGWRVENVVSPLPPDARLTVCALLESGAKSELVISPSKSKSSVAAQNPYEEIARTGMRQVVARLFERTQIAEQPKRPRILLIVHNLDAPERPEKLVSIQRLKTALAEQGADFLCLHHSRNPAPGGEIGEINFFDPILEVVAAEFGELHGLTSLVPAFDREVLNLGQIGRDEALGHAVQMAFGFLTAQNRAPRTWEEAKNQVLDEARKLDVVLRGVQPDVVLLWHQWNTVMHVAREICRRLGIPSAFLHEGALPRTMSFDSHGMMAESDSAGVKIVDDDHQSDSYRRHAEHVIAAVREQKLDRKPVLPLSAAGDVAASIRARKRPILFYAGINDWHSGVLPVTQGSALHSPHFGDTSDALSDLLALCEENDWYVLFKPHPNLFAGHYKLQHPRLITVRETSPVECILSCDVTITLLSSVSYISLSHGKPTVLLGRNTLSGTGAAYELTARDDLAALIEQALTGQALDSKLTSFRDHVAALLRDHLFPYGGDETLSLKSYQSLAQKILALRC